MNSSDKVTQRMLEIIKDTLKGTRQHTGKYSMRYSDNEDMVDYIINYNVSKISMWKNKDDRECKFEGTIYVKINKVIVGFEGTNDWETARIDDLPSWTEDDFKESIQSELDIFQGICLDIDYVK